MKGIANILIRDIGGFGYKSKNPIQLSEIPTGKPDLIVKEQTFNIQAMLYRLQGDTNPIHIDPKTARKAKFERPILHGLCTHSIVARVIYEKCLKNEVKRMKAIQCRFKKPVYPGDLLTINIWNKTDGVLFSVLVDKRDQVVVLTGEVEFHKE